MDHKNLKDSIGNALHRKANKKDIAVQMQEIVQKINSRLKKEDLAEVRAQMGECVRLNELQDFEKGLLQKLKDSEHKTMTGVMNAFNEIQATSGPGIFKELVEGVR